MKSKMYSRPIITSGRGALGSCPPAAKLRSPIYFKIQISLHTSLAFNSIVISELTLLLKMYIIIASGAGYETDFFRTNLRRGREKASQFSALITRIPTQSRFWSTFLFLNIPKNQFHTLLSGKFFVWSKKIFYSVDSPFGKLNVEINFKIYGEINFVASEIFFSLIETIYFM